MRIEQYLYSKGYRITENGILLNPKGKVIVGFFSPDGYKETKHKVNKKSKRVRFHRLQAFQKYGNKLYDEGIESRHLNGIKTDNSWDNISIGTHSQNMMDIPEAIRIAKALHATSFIIKHDKKVIKKFHQIDKSYKKTMLKFNISSKGTLHYILNY